MNLEELTQLIAIRQYVVGSINNSYIDRPTVSELNGMLILLDNKIIAMLKSNEFKEYIDYQNVRQAITDVSKITNIKSGIKK